MHTYTDEHECIHSPSHIFEFAVLLTEISQLPVQADCLSFAYHRCLLSSTILNIAFDQC